MNRPDAYAAILRLRGTLDDAAGQITDLVTAAQSHADGDETPRAVLDAVDGITAAAVTLDDLIQVCHDAESRTYRDGLAERRTVGTDRGGTRARRRR